MARPTIYVKFKVSRDLLIRIVSQQLVADWRGRPESQEECLTRVTDYLTGVIVADLKRLRQLYEGEPGAEGEAVMELLGGDSAWVKAHMDGVKFKDQAAEIVDEHFPRLAKREREAIIE
jgi:hypothetical protein